LLNSKELLERTGISRATLNNYIALGIVPRPEVLPPQPEDGAAPRIGYFPAGTAERVAEIQRLKHEGWSMSRIAAHFAAGVAEPATPRGDAAALAVPAAPPRELPRLSIGEIGHPAYLASRDLSLLWTNPGGQALLGGAGVGDNALLRLLQIPGGDRIARFHLDQALQHGASLERLERDLSDAQRTRMQALAPVPAGRARAVISHIWGEADAATDQRVCVYAVQFGEGVLFVHVPQGPQAEQLGALLQARELVAGSPERRRLPALGDVAVVVMDLDQAQRIWAALPAAEYFELINQIWLAAEPILRRHRGTPGKHPRDGIACHFLGQRDADYAWNAILAAHELREAMRHVSQAWRQRKGWAIELRMNTGIDEGRQWVGTLQSGAGAEFTMFGETLNRAAQLSEFAGEGAIWVTKDLLAKLAPQEQQRLTWGLRQHAAGGREALVPAVFSTAERLAEPSAEPGRWRAIAALPITEIVAVAGPEGHRARTTDQQPI